MGYNANDPATWSVKQLLEYARQRNIEVPSGCEKTELVALVDEYFTDELLVEHIRKEQALETARMHDIVNESPATILRHVADAAYTDVLRRHPATLQSILDAGLAQLQSLTFVARLCSARVHTPLQAWLSTLALDDGHGKTMQSTMTAVASSGAAATSSVCGRFCGEHEMVVRCLDCGSDTTCVMCMDCFRNSPCVHHRYRINHSSGGGMCDCGDPTAWKPESFCSRHRAANAGGTASGSGSAAPAADPLDALAEEDKSWVVPVLRATIQYIALALLQHTRLQAVVQQRRNRAPPRGNNNSNSDGGDGGGDGGGRARRPSASSSGSRAASAPQSPHGSGTRGCSGGSDSTTAEGEAALLHHVARISDKFDWLAEWMTEVTRQLWELMQASELAKHLVAQLWMEPLALSRSHDALDAATENEEGQEGRQVDAEAALAAADVVLAALPHPFSCVHAVFLYEAAQPVTAQEEPARGKRRTAPWLNHLLRCVGRCVSDAKFRLPIGGLMASYAEYINAHDRGDGNEESLSQYQVQVLTNPDVVRHLMQPSNLPYAGARDTVVHRELAAVLYTLWLARDTAAEVNPVRATAATATDGLLFIEHQHRSVSLTSVSTLQACMTALPAACYTLVVNRLAWRALAQVSGSLGVSGYILKDPNGPAETQHYPYPDFMGRFLFRNTWLWLHAIRTVMATLLSDPAAVCGSATSDASSPTMPRLSPEAVTAALGLPVELWGVWREAVAFDAPPDRHRQKPGLLGMLAACRVQRGAEEGLLLLQDGPLAEAQARALTQPSANADSGVGVAASPALMSAMGYTVQLLHELSRTMEVVLDKQRDGFRRGCRAVALERRRAPGSSGDSVSSGGGGAEDVMEYGLLEPQCHATTFSNYLPRMFAAVLTAWVIEHQRCASRRQSTTAAAAAAPTASRAAARISGLPSAGASADSDKAGETHVSRPLRAVLDAFFHLRAAQLPARSRLTFAQELLDALVMPRVLSGQVQDGLWRRGDYDVASAVSMYLSYARGVSAEFDMLLLQVLTMELPAADMALQLLQRFSYTRRRSPGLPAAASPPPLPPLPPHLHQPPGGNATAPAPPPRHRARHGGGPTPLPITSPTGTGATARRHHFRCYLSGYKHLLRLVLTMVTDTAKAAFHAPMSAAVIDRIVGNVLAHGKASHSAIVASVNDTARSGDFGDADEDEKDSRGNVIKFSKLVDVAIHKLAVGESSAHGKLFRLRDTDVWRTHVDLYRVGAVDGLLDKLHGTYRSLVSAVRAARQGEEAHGEAEAEATGGAGGSGDTPASSTAAASSRVALPPTQLSDNAMYAELLPTTRALLHTDAVLQPALFLLHEYVNSHVPLAAAGDGKSADTADAAPPSPPSAPAAVDSGAGTASDSSSSDGDEDEEDANLISREAVLHATTALYLCMQDCVAITRGMRAVEGIAEDAHTGGAAATAIDWDLVKLYLARFCVNESTFTETSRASWLPLPPLTRGTTLLDKLNIAVRLVLPPTVVMAAHATTETSAAMLHRLRGYLLANKDADPYGCLEMIEEVLVRTGLATFSSAAVLAEQRTKDEAALNRKKLIQERQAMLMQRMRSRALKTSKSKAAAAVAATAAEEDARAAPTAAASPTQLVGSPTSPTGGPMASLLMKLLMELTTVDCCVCRSATEEPLFLLCHTSTSGVLPRLGALALPDGRHVHSHLSMCGHAAHKSCVEKVFIRLAVLWQRWNFRSQLYLGPTEFNCPVCTTIITALCPMPALPLSTTAAGSPTGAVDAASPTSPTERRLTSSSAAAGASLFEELQSGTVPASSQRAADVAAQFHANMANAAVGFSPSEDVPAIVSAEDALQQHNEAAWQVSETVRGFCYAAHLQLEAVKAGQAISQRDLISLLALLLSLTPSELQRHEADLRANYARNTQDKESELVLTALLRPREASRHISAHLREQVLPSMPPGYVRRLLACVGGDTDSGRSDDGGDSGEGEGAVSASLAEALEVDFPDTTVTLWTTAGVLTLLKALVVEDAHHGIVLARGTFTVSGSINFVALSVASVQTPAARCAAVVRMLQYLLPLPHKDASAPLSVVAADVAACVQAPVVTAAPHASSTAGIVLVKPAVAFTTSEQWVAQVAERLLHLPPVYATVLTSFAERKRCAVCRSEPVKPVVCCGCGQLMCLQPPSSPPELYTHTRTCTGAVGVYLFVRTASYYVLELTSGRAYQYPSTYTDEYGEHDRYLRRGIPLFRNAEETQRFVMAWMLNKWGVMSSIFNASNRMDLSVL